MHFQVQCPFLPPAQAGMSYRNLRAARIEGDEAYYLEALRYGNALWGQGHAGRAILSITRALYLDLAEQDAALHAWPLPYKALAWIVAQHPSEDFPGNPRVSFQHQATRMQGTREAILRARAWAVWALIRQVKPSLPGDESQELREPGLKEIEALLDQNGHSNEVGIWKSALLEFE